MGRLATLRQLPRGSPAPGEVMTLAPGSTIATGGVLFDDPHLPKPWWTDLDAALTALTAHPVTMEHELDAVRYPINGILQALWVTLTQDTFAGLEWATAHADLHWGNLCGPTLCILDWESWRPAPAGYDAATLYRNSLLHQPTAQQIRTLPVLETRTGEIALLFAICRYLWVVGEGSDLNQAEKHLRSEGAGLVSRLAADHPHSPKTHDPQHYTGRS